MINVSNYDEDSDSLIISAREDNERVKTNFVLGDFIISLTGGGKVVSLEIREFSNFLKEYGIDFKRVEKEMGNLTLIVKPKKEMLFIGVGLNNQAIKQIPVANIPLPCIKN